MGKNISSPSLNLWLHSILLDDLNQLQPLNMTEWEKKREKVEFDQAEKLLTSLSKGLKNRFLPSSQSEDLTDPLAVVEKVT